MGSYGQAPLDSTARPLGAQEGRWHVPGTLAEQTAFNLAEGITLGARTRRGHGTEMLTYLNPHGASIPT